MAWRKINDTKLTAIANAIRGKTGKEATLTLDAMPAEISAIETGSTLDFMQVTIKAANEETTGNVQVYDAKDEEWVALTTGGISVNILGYVAIKNLTDLMTLEVNAYKLVGTGFERLKYTFGSYTANQYSLYDLGYLITYKILDDYGLDYISIYAPPD